jgi:hypothetical protein
MYLSDKLAAEWLRSFLGRVLGAFVCCFAAIIVGVDVSFAPASAMMHCRPALFHCMH